MGSKAHPALAPIAATSYFVIRALPLSLASGLLGRVTARFPEFFVKARAIRRNLRVAFPAMDDTAVEAMLSRIAGSFGRTVAELAHIGAFASEARASALAPVDDPEYPYRNHGPAIYVTAHLGNWELLPLIFKRLNMPVHIIYTELKQPTLDSLLLKLRRVTGATMVEKDQALRACIAAMSRGESLAMLVDQRPESGLEVEFFGQPTVFTRFPARMATRFDCPIIVANAIRVGAGQFRVHFHPPIHPEGGKGPETERRMTQQMAAALEEAIRRNPEQWFCNTVRWRDPRPAAPAVEAASRPT